MMCKNRERSRAGSEEGLETIFKERERQKKRLVADHALLTFTSGTSEQFWEVETDLKW